MNVNEILTDPASAPHGTIVVKAGVAYVKNTKAASYNDGDYRDPRRYPWLNVRGEEVITAGAWCDGTVEGGTIVYVPERPIEVGSTFTAQEMRDRIGDFRSGTVAVHPGGVAAQLDGYKWITTFSDSGGNFSTLRDYVKFQIIYVPEN